MDHTSTLALLALACALSFAGSTRSAPSITVDALAERIDGEQAPVILDVRSVAEFERGHVRGAIHIPHDELAARLDELPSDPGEEVVLYCQTGRRAALAAAVLHEAGYEHLHDLEGHWQAWEAAGLPVTR